MSPEARIFGIEATRSKIFLAMLIASSGKHIEKFSSWADAKVIISSRMFASYDVDSVLQEISFRALTQFIRTLLRLNVQSV